MVTGSAYRPSVLVKSVVGFDFWDVAKPVGPIRQRIYSLRIGGHGWVDYIRSIKATTIFGNKFGELIRAENPDLICPNWRTVPTGMDYMSTSIATLKIVHNAKETALDPGEITRHIMWSSHYELFSKCGCLASQPDHNVLHLDPVQLLLPKERKVLLNVPKMCVNIILNDLEKQWRGCVQSCALHNWTQGEGREIWTPGRVRDWWWPQLQVEQKPGSSKPLDRE